MRIYIAGPMSGIKDYNYPAFEAMAVHLRGFGNEVVSPAEMDIENDDVPSHDGDWVPDVDAYERAMARDLKALAECDAIMLLEGWRDSPGARREHRHAVALGLKVYEESACIFNYA